MIKVAGGVPVAVPRWSRNSSRSTWMRLTLINEKTKLIILNSPSNPTGGVILPADLGIASQAERCGCWVMSDEIIRASCTTGWKRFDCQPACLQERTIIVDGFSKTIR
jgi:aspartate/methionine/tyrosine aminotransferase